jgi:hypothetical protein
MISGVLGVLPSKDVRKMQMLGCLAWTSRCLCCQYLACSWECRRIGSPAPGRFLLARKGKGSLGTKQAPIKQLHRCELTGIKLADT